MYAREIEGTTYTFGVSGMLIRNALVMYDHQTESLWSQFLGEAVEGELTGVRLEPVPAILTDWYSWKQLHPDTLVLKQNQERIDPYGFYYFLDPSAGVIGETHRDDRYIAKEFVFGVQIPEGAMAFPFRYMDTDPVAHVEIGERPVLFTYDRIGATPTAWDRRLDERTLTFEPIEVPVGERLLLRDVETGSTWLAVTGTAIAGPLEGAQLTGLNGSIVFWFAWTDFHPDAPVWVPEGQE